MIRIIQRTLICWLLCVNVTSAQELVIATTLSSEATEHIISQWQKQPPQPKSEHSTEPVHPLSACLKIHWVKILIWY